MIERPIVDDIDCSGWDLRKALHLFTRTNGALLEWLNSPVRYMERGTFAASLRQLAVAHFNATALCYHYSHMARRNFREHLIGSRVRLKKYLYVLRPAARDPAHRAGARRSAGPVRVAGGGGGAGRGPPRHRQAARRQASRSRTGAPANPSPNSIASSMPNSIGTKTRSPASVVRTCWNLQTWGCA